jgi:hypothetical protein
MSDPEAYAIRNWEQYQHYKDRNPPWIKLYREIMWSRDWVNWDDASKLLAIVCMMLASENDGLIPNDIGFIRRRAYLEKSPNLKPLITSGFLVDASDMLASCTQMLDQRQRQSRDSDSNSSVDSEESTSTESTTKGKFEPPTLEEVTAYFLEKGVKEAPAIKNAKEFVSFYESKGWMVGKNKMRQWRSAVSGWITRNNLDTSLKGKWETEDALRRAKELADVPF